MKRLSIPIALFLTATSTAYAQIPQSEYATHRTNLAAAIGNGILIAFGSGEPEQDFLSFYQNPHFYYLAGLKEPGAALVMRKTDAGVVTTLFVEPRDPAREVWTGSRLGPAGAARALGFAARETSGLIPYLDSLLAVDSTLYVVGNIAASQSLLSPDDQFVRALRVKHPNLNVINVNAKVNELRRVKSAAELEMIRKAVDITVIAQREAMRVAEPGMNEFEVQALIEYTFRRNGADRPSFSTIVGSGPNSTTLHYNVDDRFMNAGETVVMDIGASYRGYAADVTRTIPVSGKFTADQRAVYQIVRDAQAAAERQAKVGALARDMTDSSNVVIAAGLARLGLTESPSATYDCDAAASRQCPQYFLYYMHGLGHGIGLDVHDPGAAPSRNATTRLVEGSAFTIEPGIYVRENLVGILPNTPRNRALGETIRAAVKRYANIGVRIEDDYIVTAAGVDWISRAPREISEVEAEMRKPYAGPLPRNRSMVELYRATTPRESR
ncbi:MAG: aminopeptidase P N-terminal domain-containing protein [Gemmatimonadaceae bacterium]|nr:aminopeptidase P N-terminal domain-containing protein [Gemmatimonadaceae bacterium]